MQLETVINKLLRFLKERTEASYPYQSHLEGLTVWKITSI